MAGHLASHSYGKHSVRVSKVRRPRTAAANTEQHDFVEVSVDVELEGDFDAAFTAGNNRTVIATDTCKNIVYVLAKEHSLETIESFGLVIAEHFLSQYDQVERCTVSLSEQVWDRLLESPHAFTARDRATPTAKISLARNGKKQLAAGVEHLLIAKTTESGFADFHRDKFRTLADTEDRILATELSASWIYASTEADFVGDRKMIVDALLARFINHYSHSIQETLHLMGQAALDACLAVNQITLMMPNKHHLLADLSPFNRENENEVFVVTDEPFGSITGTLSRS